MKLISDVRIGRWELCVHGVFAACAVLHLLFWCAGIRFDGLSFGSQIAMMRVAGCPPHGVPSWCARPSLLQTFAHLRELERGICSVLYGTRQNRLGMLYAPSRAAAVHKRNLWGGDGVLTGCYAAPDADSLRRTKESSFVHSWSRHTHRMHSSTQHTLAYTRDRSTFPKISSWYIATSM